MERTDHKFNYEGQLPQIRIIINPFSAGSFSVHFELLKDIAKDLLPPTAFVGAGINIHNIIKVLIEFIKSKLFFPGGKPKEIHKSGNEVTITDTGPFCIRVHTLCKFFPYCFHAVQSAGFCH